MAAPGTRTLVLLRHAKSSWNDGAADDFDRPLAPRGREAARRLAADLCALVRPDLILCSTARRTRETLEPILAACSHDVQVRFERSLYLADAGSLLGVVRGLPATAGTALLVGHNPGMHELAAMLAGAGDPELRRRLEGKFPTGAMAIIEIAGPWSKAVAGAGRLVAYRTPRELP
ncbi:MAG: histidine phosphatase family protein [Alphaproteobacteria bacterium]|nr:histidine phosphatase family protein [Alphaproteobacteria bacterium]